MDVNGIIERAKKALELQQDQELADYLGVSRSTIAAWKRRGSIPAKYLSDMLGGGTISLDWLVSGSGTVKTVGEYGLTEQPLEIDKEDLWLALLATRAELAASNGARDNELAKQLTDSDLATLHIWIGEYATRIKASRNKWLTSGLIKSKDIYRALVTEYAVGAFDAPPPPWWEDDKIV